MRPLAVASAKRLKQFPDVPAVAETLPGYEMTAWIGSFVPAATPRPIVERLNTEFRKSLDHPDVTKILGAQALDPMPMTVDEFNQRLLETVQLGRTAFVSSTRVAGRFWLRACVINHRTSEADIDLLVDHIEQTALTLSSQHPGP